MNRRIHPTYDFSVLRLPWRKRFASRTRSNSLGGRGLVWPASRTSEGGVGTIDGAPGVRPQRRPSLISSAIPDRRAGADRNRWHGSTTSYAKLRTARSKAPCAQGVIIATKIEQFAPELEKIISPSEPIQALADGFGGAQGPAEGPLWWKEGRYLLFSDIHNNKRMKYVPGQGVSLFLEPTNRANGLTRDLQGRLLACEHDTRRVTRREHIRAFDLLPNGTLAKQTDRIFADLGGDEPGVPDGMKVDVEGNVYCGGAGGIWIMDPRGKKLGRIMHGAPATTNIAFGG